MDPAQATAWPTGGLMFDLIPIGPTSGDKDGSWRGGAALVGVWTLALLFGVLTPLPTIVWGRGTLASVLDVVFLIGIIMSLPYAWRWVRGGDSPAEPDKKGPLLFEQVNPNDGRVHRVYQPEKGNGWSPPLNRGISRSLDSRMTIWRELSWVAPVTFGDIILTWAWNIVLMLTGGFHERRRPRKQDRESPDYGDEEFV